MKDTKVKITLVVLALWGCFGLWYVLNDTWTDFQTTQVQQSYQAGVNDGLTQAVSQLMAQVEANNCNAFPVFLGKQQVNLVRAECVAGVQPATTNTNLNAK